MILGSLAEIYGLSVAPEAAATSLADYFGQELGRELGRVPKPGDTVPLGPIVLVVHGLDHDRVSAVGLRLPEEETPPEKLRLTDRLKRLVRHLDPFHDH